MNNADQHLRDEFNRHGVIAESLFKEFKELKDGHFYRNAISAIEKALGLRSPQLKRDKVKSMIETAPDVTIANILDVLEGVSSVVNPEAFQMDVTHDLGNKFDTDTVHEFITYFYKWIDENTV